MTFAPARRQLLLALAGLAASPRPARAIQDDPIVALERRHGGRLGVFALDTGTGRTLAHRAEERFMLFSTFKGLLAAEVLAAVDAREEYLDAPVSYTAADLLPASPITSAHAEEGTLTVGALCLAIMHQSDNAAANLLLRRRGGPQALTAFLRRIGDSVTRCDRYETAAGKPSGLLDTTTPRAIVETARTLLLGTALTSASRVTLETWMAGNEVGRSRLRAAFPGDWAAGDRTGTGDGYCNDYAIARRSGRAPLLVSAYYETQGQALPVQEAVIRAVGAAIVAWQV